MDCIQDFNGKGLKLFTLGHHLVEMLFAQHPVGFAVVRVCQMDHVLVGRLDGHAIGAHQVAARVLIELVIAAFEAITHCLPPSHAASGRHYTLG
jgi:hypothetical protein